MVASGAGSLGLAGVRLQISSKVCIMCTPSRLSAPPAHFTHGRPPGEVDVGLGRGGSKLEVLEWGGGGRGHTAVAGVAAPGGAGAAVAAAGGGGRVRRRGQQVARWGSWGEEEVDMGRRWRAWQRLRERERRWRGLGVDDAYGRQGEQEARWGSWWEEEVDMGQRWRAWRRPGERERRERGPGGSCWLLGEQERRE